MMKFQITIFLILLLFFACESKNELVTEEISETSKIINEDSLTLIIISELIGKSDSLIRTPAPPPPPLAQVRLDNETDEEYESRCHQNVLNYIETTNQKSALTHFVYYINENLFSLKFEYVFEYLDKTFVFDTLKHPFTNDQKIINLDSIKQNNFKLISERYSNPKTSQFYHIENFNGIMNFSKMLFNKDYTKVIFSFDNVTSCGMTYQLKTIKMEYIDNQWLLIEQKTIY